MTSPLSLQIIFLIFASAMGDSTKCSKVGTCQPCTNMLTKNECTGHLQQFNCTNTAEDGSVIPSVKYEVCYMDEVETANADSSFWHFEVAMTLTLAVSAYVTTKRQRYIHKIRENRLSRLVNS
mmetsp:Transcript_16140/g.30636  ORF Transcript_16140/g.30636 Transcript_16140/m.30636 type:complete len:123 (-) Transcript_16140:85-453(-)